MVEPVIGLYGLRTFRISRDLHLVPAALRTADWRDGTCVARCRSLYAATLSGPLHEAPDPGCSCGVYAVRSLEFLRRQYSTARDVVAVVALEGQTVEGEYGWRTQAARVVALYLRRGLLADSETEQLLDHLPADARLFSDAAEMVAEYPDLEVDEPASVIQRKFTGWHRSALVPVLAPLMAAGVAVQIPPAFRWLYDAAHAPVVPYFAAAAVLAIAAYATAFAIRPRWRMRLTAAPVIALVTLAVVTVWTLLTIRELSGGATTAETPLLTAWVVGAVVLAAKRPRAGALTRNPLRLRTRTRVRWAISDPAPSLRRKKRYG